MAEMTIALGKGSMKKIKIKGSGLKFVATLTSWSLLSIVVLFIMVTIVARMSFSFFEANGMMKDEALRGALTDQLFLAVDPSFFGLLLLGVLSVAVFAYVFAHSQVGYVNRFNQTLHTFVDNWTPPKIENLGIFGVHAADFFEVMNLRIKKESNEKIEAALQKALRNWPTEPHVNPQDIVQFVAVSLILSTFFAACCHAFFTQIGIRLVDLGQHIVKYTNPNAPLFLREQEDLVQMLVWIVIIVTSIGFISNGYKLGRLLAESNYAILRDLRRFMQGDKDQRIFLRATDPIADLVPKMNEALERMSKKV